MENKRTCSSIQIWKIFEYEIVYKFSILLSLCRNVTFCWSALGVCGSGDTLTMATSLRGWGRHATPLSIRGTNGTKALELNHMSDEEAEKNILASVKLFWNVFFGGEF